MTAASISAANDEMATMFANAWANGGYDAANIEWPNVDFNRPALSATWARFSIVGNGGGQRTLAGATGLSRFGRVGFVMVEIFTPLGKGIKLSADAAEVALNAYEGERTPSDVWFKNVRIASEGQGSGGDKAWWQTTIIAEFDFEQFN